MSILFLGFFGLASIWFGLRVFMTRSMVRSAYSLLGSMASLGAMFLVMKAQFLGVLQLMMMATEMSVMAVFMMMFMMDPGGMGKMEMTHQKRPSFLVAIAAGFSVFLVIVVTFWSNPQPALPGSFITLRGLGLEIMQRSLLIFEAAGLSVLTTMIASTMLVMNRGKENN